jgi:hypothetical protein
MMRRVITVPIDVSTISQTAFLRPTGAEPSLHRPPARWLAAVGLGGDGQWWCYGRNVSTRTRVWQPLYSGRSSI